MNWKNYYGLPIKIEPNRCIIVIRVKGALFYMGFDMT